MRFSAFAALVVTILLFAPMSRAEESDTTVPTYHADEARSGHYVVPGLTWARAAGFRRDPAFDGRVPGNVYAQPLYWRPAGAARGLVIAATEDNVVAALDAVTGSTVWRSRLGPAVPLSKLECGNIDPLGVTGTPVIDERKGALYLDAMVDGDKGPRHLVFGLSLADGAVMPGWPVDTANALQAIGMTFNAPAQGERGALTLAGGKLYVPYGGHFGECGDYRGWVVAFNLDKPAAFAAWRTPVKMAGIWAPGGVAFDGSHLFAAVGHTLNGSEQWNGANSVIRLPPDLNWRPESADFFAPADWFELNRRYYVLAYNNPLAIDLPDGGPGSALLFALDKNGKAYLLDRANLGGVGHPLLARQVGEVGLPANTSPVAWRVDRDMMVAFAGFASTFPGVGGGVTALRISGGAQPAIETAWRAKLYGLGAPIVTTSGPSADPIVWIVGAEGDQKLHGFRGDTGQEIFASEKLDGLRHYATILAAANRLYLAGDGQIFAFGPAP
jgi:outer membrane protein assembly factor BamB